MRLKNLSSAEIRVLIDMAEICKSSDATKDEKDAAFATIKEVCFPTEARDFDAEYCQLDRTPTPATGRQE